MAYGAGRARASGARVADPGLSGRNGLRALSESGQLLSEINLLDVPDRIHC